MSDQRSCDFCGRSESDLPAQAPNGSPVIEKDPDGLWVCYNCRDTLVLSAVGELAGETPQEFAALVGKSAGTICRTLNLPYRPPYRSIIDAASTIAYDQDRYMSAWSFATQWSDGTTVWRDASDESIAIVAPDGSVRIEPG
jgi:hypothetical protein